MHEAIVKKEVPSGRAAERLTAIQRAERNSYIARYIVQHGDQHKTFVAVASRWGLTPARIRDIWRTWFNHWNYNRYLKKMPIIVNVGSSTKRARYTIVAADAHHMSKARVESLYGNEPRYTIEAAFAEMARRERNAGENRASEN